MLAFPATRPTMPLETETKNIETETTAFETKTRSLETETIKNWSGDRDRYPDFIISAWMALNTSKCNHLTPLCFKWLK